MWFVHFRDNLFCLSVIWVWFCRNHLAGCCSGLLRSECFFGVVWCYLYISAIVDGIFGVICVIWSVIISCDFINYWLDRNWFGLLWFCVICTFLMIIDVFNVICVWIGPESFSVILFRSGYVRVGFFWCGLVWFGVIYTFLAIINFFCVIWSWIIWCDFFQIWLYRNVFLLVWFDVICTFLATIMVVFWIWVWFDLKSFGEVIQIEMFLFGVVWCNFYIFCDNRRFLVWFGYD